MHRPRETRSSARQRTAKNLTSRQTPLPASTIPPTPANWQPRSSSSPARPSDAASSLSELSDAASSLSSDACDSCKDDDSDEEAGGRVSNIPTLKSAHASHGNGGNKRTSPPPRKRKRNQATPTSESDTDCSSDNDLHKSPGRAPPKRARKASVSASTAKDPLDSGVTASNKPGAPKKKSGSSTKETMTIVRLANASKLIGAHISVAGGLENATVNAMKIGCNAMSFFLTSPRTWNSKPLTEKTIAAFKHNCAAHGYASDATMIPHGSYLVNLGNPDPELREKSYNFFLDELKRCDALGIKYYNFHPGSSVGKCTPSECIQHIAACVNRALAKTSSVHAIIENTAGQGQVVGHSWEQLRELIDLIDDKSRVGVCLDTCHMFAAGYDLRTKEAFDQSFGAFDDVVGFKYLKAFHVNDSKGALGSKKDRHAPLGQGEIGLEPFKWLMQKPEFDGRLFILETPEECNWTGEIKLLHSYMLESETKVMIDQN